MNHYPLTDKGRIEYWLKIKNIFQTKYNIPRSDEDGIYNFFLALVRDVKKRVNMSVYALVI